MRGRFEAAGSGEAGALRRFVRAVVRRNRLGLAAARRNQRHTMPMNSRKRFMCDYLLSNTHVDAFSVESGFNFRRPPARRGRFLRPDWFIRSATIPLRGHGNVAIPDRARQRSPRARSRGRSGSAACAAAASRLARARRRARGASRRWPTPGCSRTTSCRPPRRSAGRPTRCVSRSADARLSTLWRLHGRLTFARGEQSRAIALHSRALKHAELAHDSRAIGLAHYELALCYKQVGDTGIVRDHLTEAAVRPCTPPAIGVILRSCIRCPRSSSRSRAATTRRPPRCDRANGWRSPSPPTMCSPASCTTRRTSR